MDLSLLPSLAHYSNILSSAGGVSGTPTPTPPPPAPPTATTAVTETMSPTNSNPPDGFFYPHHTHPYQSSYSPYGSGDESAVSAYHPQGYHHHYHRHSYHHQHQHYVQQQEHQKLSPTPFIHTSYNNDDHCFVDSAAASFSVSAESTPDWNPGDAGSENLNARKYCPPIIDYYHPNSANGYHHDPGEEEPEEDAIDDDVDDGGIVVHEEGKNQHHPHRHGSKIKSNTTTTTVGEEENFITITTTTTTTNGVVRVVKRRSANKKERRRTQSINSAFSNLRDCIPNVPADTKLSKIKTLRLATSYISYLMKLLDGPRENSTKLLNEGFRADLSNAKRSTQQNRIETQNEIQRQLRMQQYRNAIAATTSASSRNRNHHRNHSSKSSSSSSSLSSATATGAIIQQPFDLSVEKVTSGIAVKTASCQLNNDDDRCHNSNGDPTLIPGTDDQYQCNHQPTILLPQPLPPHKPRCRTGWPQHVWALELKHYEHQHHQHQTG